MRLLGLHGDGNEGAREEQRREGKEFCFKPILESFIDGEAELRY